MANEEGGRDATHPFQCLVDSRQPIDSRQNLGSQYAKLTDEERHECPAQHASAEAIDGGATEDDAEEVGHVVVEGHENLLAITGIEDAQAKWQHSAHEVVAITIHRLALRIVIAQCYLYRHANDHKSDGAPPMTAIDEQAIYDVELQHQTEEPEWTRPDNVVGVGQYVIEHAQHRHDV